MVPGDRNHNGANRYIPHQPTLENQFERRQLARQTHAQRWPPGFRSSSMAVAGIEGPQHQGRPPRKSQAEFARSRLLFGLRVASPPRPPHWRLLSGSCASDRVVASGFLPTTPRGAAVAVRRGVPHTKVPRGLASPRHAPYLAHNARPRWQRHRGLIEKPWSRPLRVWNLRGPGNRSCWRQRPRTGRELARALARSPLGGNCQ